MKKYFFFFAVALVASLGVIAQQTPDKLIQISESYDFGKIKQGVPVTTFFEIKNISNQPIVIESATAGCGCTTPEVTKEPIAPGATAKMKVGYNAAAMGQFNKPVTLKLAGVNDTKQIMISGEVLDEAAYTEYSKSLPAKKSVADPASAKTKTKKS